MPTRYAKLEECSEVMDVLYCVVLGIDSVKEMTEKLKQPQPSISSKLRFLRKNKVVIKDKWNYEPAWNGIYRAMLQSLQDVLEYYNLLARKQGKRMSKNLWKMFSKEVLLGILKVYSNIYFYGYEKLSMEEIAKSFLSQLARADKKRIKKIDPKLLEVQRQLKKIRTKEDMLFGEL